MTVVLGQYTVLTFHLRVISHSYARPRQPVGAEFYVSGARHFVFIRLQYKAKDSYKVDVQNNIC